MNKDNSTIVALGSPAKVRPNHLERLAYIYVRQSSPKQVAQNQESQIYQRHLAHRAEALGWPKERIRIIDSDQAQSGKESTNRSGFQELVAEISLGHVGIIFGYEVSRLARNNRDWYHLLDLAAVFDTLIADNDGVYNLRLYNDRLLLGLKGTMSEAELHLLKQRLDAGRMSQVRRGAYRQMLPTGLVRLSDNRVVKDPDDQVRHVIKLVFVKFEESGSCNQVVRYFRKENILLPRHQSSGFHAGETLWKVASHAAVYDILRNPAYAGVFVYGRKQLDPTRQRPGQPSSGRIKRPMKEWLHIQHDAYPAYITWAQYLTNQKRLRQNATLFTENKLRAQGAARKGTALLQGLATCGYCAHRLYVSYKATPRDRTIEAKSCMSLHGPSIDRVVEQAFFQVIRPAQLDALEAILAEQQAERQQLTLQWQQRLKRVEYEVHLARRQYNAVDPDNRLVAAELERRWEATLRELKETQEAFDHFRNTPPSVALSPELREQFRHISKTLPKLWSKLAEEQKKELLRSLIARVILKRLAPDKIEVRIVWISGHYSIAYAHPPIHRQKEVTGYDEMVKLIHQLWQEGFGDKDIAARLTAKGFHSARSAQVHPYLVMKIRLAHGWFITPERRCHVKALEGYLTIRGLAARLDIKRGVVYRWIGSGTIDPKYILRHHQNTYMIRDEPELIEKLKQQIAKKKNPAR
jgi:DNA invertase Pin-like site-specific DNA recombinase